MTQSNRLKSKLDIILYGGPGSGKTTIATELVKQFDLYHFAIGAVLRNLISLGGTLASKLAADVDKGRLIPTKLNRMILDEVVDKIPDSQSILFDGFPRTPSQSAWFDWYLSTKNRIAILVYLDVTPEVLRDRLQHRGRKDDKDAEALNRRLATFYRNRTKIIKHYTDSGHIITVDADGTPEEVTTRVIKQLNAWHLPHKK